MLLRTYALALAAMTAVAGASTGHRANADRCVVPKVIRDNLKTAEKRLAAADCEVGRVTGPRTGIVSIAWPRAGRHEPTRSRIALTFTPAPASGRAGTASSSTVAPKSSPPVPIGMPGAWHLLLDSEFNGPSLNTSIWRTGWFGDGVTAPADPNQESCYSPGNVTFPGDGTMHLNITAVPSICGGITKPYTGAGVTTNPHDGRSSGGFQYLYGALEARVYVPAAGSFIADWPAVWTDGQNWPTDGEDDALEALSGYACWSVHGPLGLKNGCLALAPGWHTFASDWEPGSITYYYDGIVVAQITTDVTGDPMYIVLDNSLRASEPADVTGPDSMQVQYVRVWQH